MSTAPPTAFSCNDEILPKCSVRKCNSLLPTALNSQLLLIINLSASELCSCFISVFIFHLLQITKVINSMMEKILTSSKMQVWGCNGSGCGLLFLHGCLRQWSDPSVLGHTQGPLWWLGLCAELLHVSYPSPFAQPIHLCPLSLCLLVFYSLVPSLTHDYFSCREPFDLW